jgi:hypothetical protein
VLSYVSLYNILYFGGFDSKINHMEIIHKERSIISLMRKFIKNLLIFIGIVAAIAGALYCVYRLLIATDNVSGTDDDSKDSILYEPMKRRYIKLNLPEE